MENRKEKIKKFDEIFRKFYIYITGFKWYKSVVK